MACTTDIKLDLNWTDLNLDEYVFPCFTRGWTVSLHTFLQTTDNTIRCKNDVIVLRKQSDKACESGIQKKERAMTHRGMIGKGI